jgi:hypothetical protein
MQMIDLESYFGPWIAIAPEAHIENALRLLERVIRLQSVMAGAGVIFRINPKTGTYISGSTLGGYRPQDCGAVGSPKSAHKQGLAVDLYDPINEVDLYLYNHQDLLDRYDIYIEHPDSTPGWSHWSIRPPASGRRVFYP